MGARFPQRMADRAELLSRSHPIRAVSTILGISQNTIISMKRNGWKPRDNSCQVRPMPSDYAIQRSRRTVKELMKHYRAGSRVVRRWNLELAARRRAA